MIPHLQALNEAVADWEGRGWPRPRVAVVSGSGLGVDLFPSEEGPRPLAELLPFPLHPVEGHPYQFEILLPRPDRPVLYLRGRLHPYQGYDAYETVFPVRLAALLGARVLLVTNAAGGLDPRQKPGDLYAVRDHLNLTGLNPLRGPLPEAWGPRFPDMGRAYDPELRRLARRRAEELAITLGEGVYAGVAGPSYETPAEVRMLQLLGAQLVGMSTVLEIIAGHHMGMRCLCLSLISNLAAGVGGDALTHDEVLAASQARGEKLQELLRAILQDENLLF